MRLKQNGIGSVEVNGLTQASAAGAGAFAEMSTAHAIGAAAEVREIR